MLGIFFVIMGFMIAGVGLGLEGFDDPKAGREIKRWFILIGFTLSFVGFVLAVFTL